MSNEAVAEAELESPPGPPSQENGRRLVAETHPLNRLERWLGEHSNAVAYAVIAIGLVARILPAARTYLNSDEALHYSLINQHSFLLAYKAGLTNAHPPLLFVVLYFWHWLGQSELMLRLPSVLLGTALCWVVFKWIELVFGKTAGMIGLVLVTLSPAMIWISSEVRQYALLLFFSAMALYLLERLFREPSVRGAWAFSCYLYLAILSHYSAAFFALAMGLYALVRIADSHTPRKVVVAWANGQAGALAIYGFLYITQVSKLKSQIAGWAGPFDQNFFHPDRKDLLTFTLHNTIYIFWYLFEQRTLAEIMLLLFAASVTFLFVRGLIPPPGVQRSCRTGILVLLPFLSIWGAAVGGIYPYVGTRHTSVLAPFAIAAISFLLAFLVRQKLWAGLLLALLAMTVANAFGKPLAWYMDNGNQDRPLMTAAVNYIEKSVPQGDLIVVDEESSFLAEYYFCGPKEVVAMTALPGGIKGFRCGGHPIAALDDGSYKLLPATLPPEFTKAAKDYGLKAGDRIWIFQAIWGNTLATELPSHAAKFRCLTSTSFGSNITVIPFTVGPDLSPVQPSASCGN